MTIGDWNEQSLQAFIRRYLDQLGLTGAFVTRNNLSVGGTGALSAVQAPQARVFNSAAITLTTGVAAALTFNSERWDIVPSGVTEQHSVSANTSRLTCQVAGLYDIGGTVAFVANATGAREIYLQVNAAARIADNFVNTNAAASSETRLPIATQYRLAVGDFVELFAFQSSGGNLNVQAAGNYSPEFWFSWLSA